MLEGEGQLVELLTRLSCSAYVVTPIQAGKELTSRIEKISSVKGAFFADVNLSELAGRIYADTVASRQVTSTGLNGIWNTSPAQGGGPTGLRIISVWNLMGGVGKTTISTNLAYEAARRGFPTLLIGLGAPDDLPLILGLKPEPNITTWWTNPSSEGIRLSIQKLDTLDVLGGFPDVLSESQVASTPTEASNSIPKLIHTAAHYAGYAVIVVDAPPSALAARAISASNTLVLVARPSLEGVMRTVEAYRTVVERLGGEHCISSENVYVVLNRVGGRLAANEWHRAASFYLGRNFPPVVAQIPDSLEVGVNQDNRRIPLLTCDEFNRAMRPLAEAILHTPQPYGNGSVTGPEKKVLNLGLLKVRL
jgi:cellulose biosynthesis protein BcsQ